jgi:uncharacterized iron-regulated membrane protein
LSNLDRRARSICSKRPTRTSFVFTPKHKDISAGMRTFYTIHRWLGWILAPFLALSACSGLLLIWLQPVPKSDQSPPSPAQLAHAIDRGLVDLTKQHENLKLSYADLPRGSESIRVRMVSSDQPEQGVWANLDPETGKLESLQLDADNLHSWLYNLHHQLLIDEIGSWPIGAAGLLGIVSILIALRMWLRVRSLRAPTVQRRWHRSIGIVMMVPMLSALVTGLFLSWPELIRRPIAALSGQARFIPPTAVPSVTPSQSISPGEALKIGASQLPSALPTRLYAAKAGIYRLRLRTDEWHPNGLNSVYVDAQSNVLRVVLWQELPLSASYTNLVYPLHIGWLPVSTDMPITIVLRVVWTLIAAALIWMVVSGIRWPKRRRTASK